MDNKTTRIEIRISPKEKEKIKEYTKQHNTTISKLFRDFLEKLFNEKEE